MIDLATAAHRRLSAFPAFQDFVLSGEIGTDAPADAPVEDQVEASWLFQGLDDDGRPFRDPEGTGRTVVVLSERGEWAAANPHNTAFFPSLLMLVYTDSTRNADGSVFFKDAESRCKMVARALDRCFHLVGATEVDRHWPGLDVHSSIRGSRFVIRDVPGTMSNTVRGEMTYETITD